MIACEPQLQEPRVSWRGGVSGLLGPAPCDPRKRQAQMVEPTLEAESGWLETIRATAIDTLAFRQACTPGYYNGEGRTEKGQGLFDNLYGPGSDAFFYLMKAWREAGDMRGLQVC
jgi:cyclohexanone monooxygenase